MKTMTELEEKRNLAVCVVGASAPPDVYGNMKRILFVLDSYANVLDVFDADKERTDFISDYPFLNLPGLFIRTTLKEVKYWLAWGSKQ